MSTTRHPLPPLTMSRPTRSFGALSCALVTVLHAAVAAPAAAATPQSHRTISNTATIEWDEGGERFTLASNRVDILVGGGGALLTPLRTFRTSGSGSGQQVSLAGAGCNAVGGFAAASLASAGPSIPSEARIEETEDLKAGDPLFLEVERAESDRDPAARDMIEVTLAAANGDHERLTLIETGANTGIFVGAVATAEMPPAPVDYDCRLAVRPGETLALDTFEGGGSPFASARLRILADNTPGLPIRLSKEAASSEALPGDPVRYRIAISNPDPTRPTGTIILTDRFGAGMRLRLDTVRLDGAPVAVQAESGGFRVTVPALAPGASAELAYALEVRPDASAGVLLNKAEAIDSRGNRSNLADAAVRIRRDTTAGRMTIIGRVTEGGCSADTRRAAGVAGVRIMLEDGSYSVTDRDGRYHFEGVLPGTHVVQLDDLTLPADRKVADCPGNSRAAGRSFSRFVEGTG